MPWPSPPPKSATLWLYIKHIRKNERWSCTEKSRRRLCHGFNFSFVFHLELRIKRRSASLLKGIAGTDVAKEASDVLLLWFEVINHFHRCLWSSCLTAFVCLLYNNTAYINGVISRTISVSWTSGSVKKQISVITFMTCVSQGE